MMLSVTVVVTAPHGTGEMGPLLTVLRDELGPGDRLIVLDGRDDGPPLDPATVPKVDVFEQVWGAGESAIHMRCRLRTLADRDITILFEDHAVPGPRFVSEVRRLLAADPTLVGFKILGRNDMSSEPWGWANFLIAFAGCIHPVTEMPPATLLSTSAALRTMALASAPQTLGAWETQFMPGLNREPRLLAFSNDVWIYHVEHSSMKLALQRHFHNQRAIAAVRVANGHRRGKLSVRAFKDLGLRRPRQIRLALAGRDEYRHFVANRWKIVVICWAATVGAIVGAWFGANNSMRKMH